MRLFGWFRSPVPRQRPLTPNALKRQQLRDIMAGMTPPRYRPEWAKPDDRFKMNGLLGSAASGGYTHPSSTSEAR